MCPLYSELGMIHVGSKGWTKAQKNYMNNQCIRLAGPLYIAEIYRKIKIRALPSREKEFCKLTNLSSPGYKI